jgi:hypothetical protein
MVLAVLFSLTFELSKSTFPQSLSLKVDHQASKESFEKVPHGDVQPAHSRNQLIFEIPEE